MSEINMSTSSEVAEGGQKIIKKNKSIHVILSMANSTIGSVALILPASVLSGGLILAIISMIIIGFINYLTCYFITIYQNEDEVDLATIVRRILGPKWCRAFILSSSFQLYVASVIYFLLINSILYPVVVFILHKSGTDSYGEKDQIVFDQFSIQYQALILAIPVFMLCSLKELNFIVKLGRIGVSSIFIYGLFLLYCFIENLSNGNISEHWDQVKLFSTNIAGVASPFSFAFFVHTVSSQITATNINFKENPRNIGYGYLIVFFAYCYFSIIGSLGVVGRIPDPSKATNINDFFSPDDIGPVVVDLLYLIHLLTALPTLVHVSRTQFFILIQGDSKPITTQQLFIFNGSVCILGLIMQLLCVDPSVVIEVNGAVCCFFIVYIIPLFFRLKLLQTTNTQKQQLESEPLLKVNNEGNYKQGFELMQIFEKTFWILALIIGFTLGIITILSVAGLQIG